MHNLKKGDSVTCNGVITHITKVSLLTGQLWYELHGMKGFFSINDIKKR